MPHGPLVPGETIIFKTRPSLVILIGLLSAVGLWFVALFYLVFELRTRGIIAPQLIQIIQIGGIIAGAFIGLVIILSWLFTIYLVTNKRIEYRSGVLAVDEKNISPSDVQNVKFRQSFLGLIFFFGDVTVLSASGDMIIFKNIALPGKRANQIEEIT